MDGDEVDPPAQHFIKRLLPETTGEEDGLGAVADDAVSGFGVGKIRTASRHRKSLEFEPLDFGAEMGIGDEIGGHLCLDPFRIPGRDDAELGRDVVLLAAKTHAPVFGTQIGVKAGRGWQILDDPFCKIPPHRTPPDETDQFDRLGATESGTVRDSLLTF